MQSHGYLNESHGWWVLTPFYLNPLQGLTGTVPKGSPSFSSTCLSYLAPFDMQYMRLLFSGVNLQTFLWTNNVQNVHGLFCCMVITTNLFPGPFSIKRPPLWGHLCHLLFSKAVGRTTKFLISQLTQGSSVSGFQVSVWWRGNQGRWGTDFD
jgi:hypothetical protein